MVYRHSVDGDQQERDESLVDALAALARRPRDLEGERVFAKLRRELAGAQAPPPRIGRFELRGQLGAGAMGVVYRAYDPELEREVAVKVLRDAASDHSEPLREARALAQLSHPNAVTVYEVGEHDGAIFVAMELVRGETLRQWLAPTRRRDEILEVMLAAGRGLAAIHGQGLVHGDFKPDNVLVGNDRVRVADFGLARLAEREHLEGEPAPLAGTPAYMAPEQLDGQPASAASDQFAFGVTLYEALEGQRPYAGESVDTLRESTRHAVDVVARSAKLSRWLRRLLGRALAATPAERHPTMDALLSELDRQLKPRHLPWTLTLVAMIAVGLFSYLGGQRHDRCAGADTHTATIWDTTQAVEARHAFVATGVARATRTFEETARAVDSYLTAWRASYRATCEATRVRGEQSAALLDQRMACLQRRLGRLGALTRLLPKVRDGAEQLAALDAVRALPEPRTCQAETSRFGKVAMPRDPALRKRVAALTERLEHGWALYALGRYREAARATEGVEGELSRLQWPIARAEWLLFLGSVRGRIGAPGAARPLLDAALAAAAEAHADRLSLRIWLRLLKDALFAGAHQRVIAWARFAKAAAARVGSSAAPIDAIVGEAELLAGQHRRARATLERAIPALEAAKAPGRTIAIALSNLGNAQLQLGDVSAAEASYRRALTVVKRDLGPDHPTLSRYIDKLGRVVRNRRQLSHALALHRHALAIREAAFGRDDRAVASSLLELGQAEIATGELDKATQHLSRALVIRRRAYGDEHLRLADVYQARGRATFAAGRTTAARGDFTRALTIRRAKSPKHPAISKLECLLGLKPAPNVTPRAALAHCGDE